MGRYGTPLPGQYFACSDPLPHANHCLNNNPQLVIRPLEVSLALTIPDTPDCRLKNNSIEQ